MSWDLTNKVVVITGGAEGIGYAIADKYLHKCVKRIIILDVNEELGSEAAGKLCAKYGKNKAVFIKCDVTTDIETISKTIFHSNNIDVLINSAAIVDETRPEKTIGTNVTGLIECSIKFWEHMRKDKGGNGGTIINLGSVSSFRIDPMAPVYQASKFAVMGFTKSLGHITNFAKSDVRVVAICPGLTETRLPMQYLKSQHIQNIDELMSFMKSLPKQTADDVGNAAVEIYQIAKTGSVWLIEAAKPVTEITE